MEDKRPLVETVADMEGEEGTGTVEGRIQPVSEGVETEEQASQQQPSQASEKRRRVERDTFAESEEQAQPILQRTTMDDFKAILENWKRQASRILSVDSLTLVQPPAQQTAVLTPHPQAHQTTAPRHEIPVQEQGAFITRQVDRSRLVWEQLAGRIEFLKDLFHEDPVKAAFMDKMMSVRTTNQVIYPSSFICSPSGSGKTTFIQHVCCGATPTIFALFEPSDVPTLQRVYCPFVGISKLIFEAEMVDLAMLRSIDMKATCLFWESTIGWHELLRCEKMSKYGQNLPNGQKISYRLVGLIAALFETIVALRRTNPSRTWLELQCSLESVSYTAMTIEEGKSKLGIINNGFEDQKMPMLLILDESIIDPDKSEMVDRFRLVRNISRCLQIVVVFAGTDARAINLNTSRNSGSGGETEAVPAEATIVFNVVPSFDSRLLLRRCETLSQRFDGFPRLAAIVDFVKKVGKQDVPWLVDLLLCQLERTGIDLGVMEMDGVVCFDALLRECVERFIERKTLVTSLAYFCRSFTRAQASYVCNYSWSDLLQQNTNGPVKLRRCNQAEEQCINRHLAYLEAYPDEPPEEPYFTLAVSGESLLYRRCPSVSYITSSLFASFKEAPITGLVLFGLRMSNMQFIDAKCHKRVTTFEAFMYPPPQNQYDILPSVTSVISLEAFCSCAFILASRVNGPAGCSVPDFIGALVYELGSPRSDVRVGCSMKPFPWEVMGDGAPRRIPLLSPMTMSGWNPHLVDLLKTIMGDGQTPCLGIFRSTKGLDRCDGVAYYHDAEEQFELDLSDQQMAAALTELRIDFPEPLIRPKRGKLVSISNYPSRIAFVVECKQLSEALCVDRVEKIVNGKFGQPDYKASELFFIVALQFGKFAREYPRKNQPILAVDGFVFWFLDDCMQLKSLPVPAARANEQNQKHVILLSLRTIWGKAWFEDNAKKFCAIHRYC